MRKRIFAAVAAAGLIASGIPDPEPQSGDAPYWAPTVAADRFIEAPAANRWYLLASTWVDLTSRPGLIGERGPDGKPYAALSDSLFSTAAPLDAAGRLVPTSLAGLGLARECPALAIADGRLAGAEGAVGERFWKLLEPYGELGLNVAELGVGTNESATVTGNVLEDEKALGTVHVAFGASAGIGGTVSVPVHLDVVVTGATLSIDGRPVLDGGRFVLDA